MVYFPGGVTWVGELIPDLSDRVGQFTVSTDELDEELVEIFVEEIVRLTGDLEKGLSYDDREMIHIAAHSIKGMGGTMGLPEISVLAQEIESTERDNDMPRCQALSNHLIDWARKLKEEG